MVNSRSKGQRGEREFLGLLSELLGLDEKLNRNLSQTREGGADCIQLPGVAIEVKNCATITLPQWWKQAVEQADRLNCVPVLAYKVARKGWYVITPANFVNGCLEYSEDLDTCVQMSPLVFVLTYKLFYPDCLQLTA